MPTTGATTSTIQVSTSAAVSSASPLNIEAWACKGSSVSNASNPPGDQWRKASRRGSAGSFDDGFIINRFP